MAQTNSPLYNDPAPVVSLPYALYDSLGLLFGAVPGRTAKQTSPNQMGKARAHASRA